MKKFLLLFIFSYSLASYGQNIQAIVSSYLGNNQRNYYGNKAPDNLQVVWKFNLGEGVSPAYGNPNKMWKGAGWTGQPLYIREKNEDFVIQPSFDYGLKKINAKTSKLVWEYKFDDILKGSPVFWENKSAKNKNNRYIIIQGSRRGAKAKLSDKKIYSLRAVSYLTGKELWRLNVKQTISYSRDVDGTVLIQNDTAYLALENAIFTVFSPKPKLAHKVGKFYEPKIFQEINYYTPSDTITHSSNIECESSPALLNGRIFTTAGNGKVYGYNIAKHDTDWIFDIGSDLDGSPTVTKDSCLLIPVEKDYINGNGGVYKINPSKSPDKCVEWFFPTGNRHWYHWEGGLVGSVSISDAYNEKNWAAFVGIDGYLYVIRHDSLNNSFKAIGTDGVSSFSTPILIYKRFIDGTISTPIIVGDKLIVGLDKSLYLFQISAAGNVKELDHIDDIEIDATPIAVDGRIYVASRDGYLYCLGKNN